MTVALKNKPEGAKLEQALAVLIASTRSRKRPLPLTEIAKWLDLALAQLGSYAGVADRIGLSPNMLRQFSNIKRLSSSVRKLFERRDLDSVDAATHLAMLPERDQGIVAAELVLGKINTSDIRAVIQLRETGESGPIDILLDRVESSKTKKQYLAEFVLRGASSRTNIFDSFSKYIPAHDIVSLELDGSIGRLVLTPSGKQYLLKAARKLGVPTKHVIPAILQ
jgi:hypothetical protein